MANDVGKLAPSQDIGRKAAEKLDFESDWQAG